MGNAIRPGAIDRWAIGLSGLCLVHCIASAVFLTMLASAGGMLLHPAVHEIGLVLAPAAILFMLAGVWLVRRVSAKLFYNVAYVLIFLVALKLIYDGYVGVFLRGQA